MSRIADPFDSLPVTDPGALKNVADGIYVWEAGDLEFTDYQDNVIGPYAVVAGQLIPVRVKAIGQGTTATISVGYHK